MTHRTFINKIINLKDLTYWDQLKRLCLYSLKRRRERYMIIYIWSILENLIPNFGAHNNGGIIGKIHVRHGRKCVVKIVRRGPFQKIISGSLSVYGAKLFNALPKDIRNLSNCTKDIFKNNLDKFLKMVPDEPQIRSYTARRRTDSNSIIDMIRVM